MTHWRRARGDIYVAAGALVAYLDRDKDSDGDATTDAYVGAMLLGEAIEMLRLVIDSLSGKRQRR